MKYTEQLTDLSEEQSEQVISDYRAMGVKARAWRQRNGKWVVTAQLDETTLEKFGNLAS